MAAVSPRLKLALGMVVVLAGAFTYSNSNTDDDSLDSEILDFPMAFVDSTDTTPATTWTPPSAARNPFESGAVAVDPERVEAVQPEADQSDPIADSTNDSADSGAPPTTSTPRRPSTTLSLEQTIDRRVPPGAPPVTEPRATDTDPATSTPATASPATATPATASTIASDDDALPGLNG